MKRIFLLLAFLPLLSLAQIKIKNLPNTTVGTGSDYLIKDRSDGGSGATQKITLDDFLRTYSISTTPNVIEGNGISLTKSGSTYTVSADNSEWTDVPFDAGDFYSGDDGTWNVGAGDVNHFRYKIVGKTMFISCSLSSTTITNTPTAAPTTLKINLPDGIIVSNSSYGVGYDSSVAPLAVLINNTEIELQMQGGALFTLGTNTRGFIFNGVVEIN